MKKTTGLILALVFVLALAGCGLPDYSAVGQGTAGSSTEVLLSFVNGTGYTLHEIYIFPASAGSRGSDLLTGTPLANGETADLIFSPAAGGEYTLFLTDNEYYDYSFTLLPLQNGGRLLVRFANETPAADVFNADGAQITTVYGTREWSGRAADSQPTGTDTGGAYAFTLHNQAGGDISFAYMAGPDGFSIDILFSVLPGGESIALFGTVPEEYWNYTEWKMYISDASGNTAALPDAFNPWAVSEVTVYWDDEAGGYTCEFVY